MTLLLSEQHQRKMICSPVGFHRIWTHNHGPIPDKCILVFQHEYHIRTTFHYSDVIMGAKTSQITSLTIVYSTVYSGADQRNIKVPCHWPLCGTSPATSEFPAQMTNYAENVSIGWRHHVCNKHHANRSKMWFTLIISWLYSLINHRLTYNCGQMNIKSI